jgi:hypothetical protein
VLFPLLLFSRKSKATTTNHAFDTLDCPSQLNVYANADAKQYVHHLIEETGHYKPSSCFQEIFMEGWSCWLDGKKITSYAELALKEFMFGKRFHEHETLKKILP